MVEYFLNDRIFWIYFIITLFFIIIGASFIISSDYDIFFISILWVISNIFLMIIIYQSSIIYCPKNNNKNSCILEENTKCFEKNNRVWLSINVCFVMLLIISVLWISEIQIGNFNQLKSISGISIILLSLILYYYIFEIKKINNSKINLIFIYLLIYIFIWFVLTVFVLYKF